MENLSRNRGFLYVPSPKFSMLLALYIAHMVQLVNINTSLLNFCLMYECFACSYISAPYACSTHGGQKGCWIPWNWGMDSCQLLCGSWEPNLGPLRDQPVLLTSEPSFQTPLLTFKGSLCSLAASFLSVMCFASIFSPSAACLFILECHSRAEVSSLNPFHQGFLSWTMLLVSCLKHHANLSHLAIPSCYILKYYASAFL